MSNEQIIPEQGKSYAYSWETVRLYRFVYIPLLATVLCLSIYLLIADTPKFIPHGLVMLGVILLFGFLLFEVLLIAYHLGPIIVNDREIQSFRPGGPVTIRWNDIEQIYYTVHPGNNIPDPYFSVCIFSKNNLIMLERGIDEIKELLAIVQQHTDTSRAKHITFSEMTKILFRYYVLSGRYTN
jgi:hypothetical protein